MTDIFLKLLNMSIAASWLVLAVLLLRFILKKAPKWISCLLWGIVALRLVMPFSVQSFFSLIPSAQVIPQNIVTSATPAIYSGIPQVNSAINPMFTQQLIRGEDPRGNILLLLSVIWIAGVTLMLLYSVVAYLKLRWQVRVSVIHQKNIYICDDVASPFILGSITPKIYIPSGMDTRQLENVLAHENAHIKRKDHWWKPLGFLLLSVYWFNPLLWLAYILLCRDIERACDEKVIAGMDNAQKKSYSEALVACSVHRRIIMACPVAFGEVSVKSRIKGIVNYKKPALWIVGISILACTLTAACFLTDPVPCVHDYRGEITVNATCTEKGMETRTCDLCKHSYTVPVELLAHTYDAGTVVTEPTCTRVGSKKHTCTGCGGTKTESVEMIAHTAGVLTVTKEPNCTQTGEASSTCTQCQAVFVAKILETNDVHDLKQTVTKAATCTKDGSAVNTCHRCGFNEEVAIEKLGHSYKTIRESKGNCIMAGVKTVECTVCGYRNPMLTSRDPNEHDWQVMGNYKLCMRCGKSMYLGSNGGRSLLDNTVGSKSSKEDLFPVIKWDLGAP